MDNSHPEILNGVKEDCEELLKRFEEKNSVRFGDFTEIWKEMHFSLVYAGRTFQDLLMFTPELFLMIKRLFVSNSQFQMKIGALYLLYGLYFKQPFRQYSKIYITLSDWLVIKQFMEQLRQFEHFDTLYILSTMIEDGAFHFSAHSMKRAHFAPEKVFRPRLWQNSKSILQIDDFDEQIKELAHVEMMYAKAKNNLSSIPDNSERFLNYSNDNVSQNLMDIMHAEVDKPLEVITIDDTEDIGERRKALKQKSFGGNQK